MTEVRVSRSVRLAIMFFAASLIGSGVTSYADEIEASPTSVYVLAPEQSRIVQTGGITGVNWSYAVEGQFRLSIDVAMATARLSHFDTRATADDQSGQALDPNSVFSATELSGVVIDANTVEFTGLSPDGGDVLVTLAFDHDSVHFDRPDRSASEVG